MASVYRIYAAKLGSTVLRGVTNASYSPEVSNLIGRHDGLQYNELAATQQYAPMGSITTVDIETGLTQVGETGQHFTTVEMYFAATLPCGGVGTAATDTGVKITLSDVCGFPGTLQASASGNDLATLTLDFHGVASDGSTPPAVFSTVAGDLLPTIASDGIDYFTGGPIKFLASASSDDITVDGVQDLSVDFAINVEKVYADGIPAPIKTFVGTREPKMTATILDPADFMDDVELGKNYPVKFYFRKIQNGAGRVGNATAEHVSVTAPLGSNINVTGMNGDTGSPATAEITVTPYFSSGEPSLTFISSDTI